MSDTPNFVQTHGIELSLGVAVLSLLVGIYGVLRPRIDADVLADPASWPQIVKELRSGSSGAYFAAVNTTLDFAKWFYGERAISAQAYGRCAQIALIYPVAAVVFGWIFFNTTTLAGLRLFEVQPELLQRLWPGAAIVAAAIAAGWMLSTAEDFGEKTGDFILEELDRDSARPGLSRQAIRALASLISGAGAVAAIVFVAVAVSFDVAGAISFTFAGAIAVAGASAGAATGAIAGAVVAVVFFAGAGAVEISTILVLFFTILPLCNAAADMASLAITRGFLSYTVNNRPGLPWIFAQLVIDLFLAAACLTALLAVTIAVLEAWAFLAPRTLAFSWRDYWAGILADPTTGTALYLMVTTTLIPTLVHVVAGLGAVLTQSSRLLTRQAREIEGWTDVPALITRRDTARAISRAKALGLAIATAIIGGFCIGLWWLLT